MFRISHNSFDLIRLLAALQVAVCHSIEYISPQYTVSAWFRFLEIFPGVPIFFFISGFLISKSYERNPELLNYATNRSLRIFPGLHVCVLINLLLVAATGYFQANSVSFLDVLTLYFAKTSFFQFYNPSFMRGFGDGVLNGSLWTICVELQFYFVTPLLYRSLIRLEKRSFDIALIVIVLVFMSFNRLLYYFEPMYASTLVWKVIRVSFFAWFYMFAFGVLAQRNFDEIIKYTHRLPAAIYVLSYVVIALVLNSLGEKFNNSIGPIEYFLLATLVLRLGYSRLVNVSDKLKSNDISYGIYIYHMPFVNMVLFYRISTELWVPVLVVLFSAFIAAISWVAIEKPCLKLKRKPFHPV